MCVGHGLFSGVSLVMCSRLCLDDEECPKLLGWLGMHDGDLLANLSINGFMNYVNVAEYVIYSCQNWRSI